MANNVEVNVSNMAQLTQEIFNESVCKQGKCDINCIQVQGITGIFNLNSKILEQKRELVVALLAELPDTFKRGYTFLDCCNNKNGELWTGMQSVCEQLVVMGIGLKLVEYCAPKEVWSILPGGVPYIIIK